MADHSRGWKAHTLHEHRDEDTLGQVVEEFDRDGFVIISGLLGPELVEMLQQPEATETGAERTELELLVL